MKKMYLLLSFFICCFMSSAYAQDRGCDSNQAWSGGQEYAGDFGGGEMTGNCPPPEKAMHDCYCLYCKYVPQYYNKWHCHYEPCYSYKKCCRYVPQCYQKTCCRMVPQYYNVTCTKQVPQYYYTCQCKQVPKYHCEKCCKWIPQYYYKHVCEPTCGDSCVEQQPCR